MGVKSLEEEMETIIEDHKTNRDMLINKNEKKIEELKARHEKEMETAQKDFEIQKEIIERKSGKYEESLKVREEKQNQKIETLTSERNSLQRKVKSIRKDLQSKFS